MNKNEVYFYSVRISLPPLMNEENFSMVDNFLENILERGLGKWFFWASIFAYVEFVIISFGR